MHNPAVQLYPYQQKWVNDLSRFKIALKARQTGFSFCASLEAVLDCLKHRTQWVFLSRGERQSKELMGKAALHARAMNAAIKEFESSFKLDKDDIKLLEINFPNGSNIIGLPANPDTARGFSANLLLDEFAFHKDSRKIWTALFPSITRGYKVRIISTPNGQNNKFYELWTGANQYSKHKTDIYEAVAQGLPADISELRENCDSEDAWQQEYCCQFIDEATAYITYDLITACESDQVSLDFADSLSFTGELYGGMDIGRKRDLTVIWLLEKLGDVFYTRLVKRMEKTPFRVQQDYLELLLTSQPKLRRFCVDSTGLGMQLAEEMQTKFGSRVEPVTFTLAVKEDMAVTLRRRFEDRQVRIPIDRTLREDIHSIKKYTTSAGNIRFDAERSEQGHCYDGKTEILTNKGWKPFSELSYSDKIASLEEEELVFVSPLEIQNYSYIGEMIRIKNKQIDLLVTLNHKLYVQFPHKKKYEFIVAAAIKDRKDRIKFKKDARWQGQDRIFYIGEHAISSELWAEFMGYFIAQGFTSTQNRVGIYNKNIEQTPIRNCLEKLPWNFWVEGNNGKIPSYRIKDYSLWLKLSKYGKQPDRYIPREILDLPIEKLKIFFDALMFGNGTKGKTTWVYCTSSYQLASDMQELLLKLGLAGSIISRQVSLKAKNKRTLYNVNINRTRLRPCINKRKKSISIEKYDGKVYCCTVPSGIIFVRREGKAVWCGNSDHFWALALGLHAGDMPMQEFVYIPVGQRQASFGAGAY